MAALSMFFSGQLITLSAVDITILVLYFAVVLFIGFYVKGDRKSVV